MDNVHVEAASARGIVVMNAPGANSISVAELAMAQMLSLARKLPAADASMKQGKWDKKSFLGEEVRGKVLGLAGLGRIGQEVARRAQAFEMTVIAHDPFIGREVARGTRHRAGVAGRSVRASGLPVAPHAVDAANQAHVQRRAARASARRAFGSMNTARGDLIDEAALVGGDRERSHRRRGARRVQRRADKDHTLQKLPQVVASPHIAASTREGQELVGVETARRCAIS